MTIIRWMRRTTTGRCRIWVIRVTLTARHHFRSSPISRHFQYPSARLIPTAAAHDSSCPRKSAKRVFALDVAGIHVLFFLEGKGVDGRDEARP